MRRNSAMTEIYDDGGLNAAGFRGKAGDCVTRSIAIATRFPHRHVYELLNEQARLERPTKGRCSSRLWAWNRTSKGLTRKNCAASIRNQGQLGSSGVTPMTTP